jgi:methyltransferase, FkbM family
MKIYWKKKNKLTMSNFFKKLKNIFQPEIVSDIAGFGRFAMRKNTSDEKVFWQIFVEKELDIDYKIEPKLIIDGGANIGASTLWFAKKFPLAQIIAVEPEESNFKILQKNCGALPNVKLIKAALWNKNIDLKIKNIALGKWGFAVEEATPNDKKKISAITVDKILADFGFEEISILKLDIEGSEKELFESGFENWLGKTKILIIELHEQLRSGAEQAFRSAIVKYNFTESRNGEKIILIKNL